MSRTAIDIVILPPPHVSDLAIEWNCKLAENLQQEIVLNHVDTLPHISVLMGGIESFKLPEAQRMLSEMAAATRAFTLEVPRLVFTESSPPVAALDIILSPDLSKLQQELTVAFAPLMRKTKESDFSDAPPIKASTIEWTNRFTVDQCGDRYWPHITLGHGRHDDQQEPFTFTATRLAIAHLGNHCTCRKILAEASLSW